MSGSLGTRVKLVDAGEIYEWMGMLEGSVGTAIQQKKLKRGGRAVRVEGLMTGEPIWVLAKQLEVVPEDEERKEA